MPNLGIWEILLILLVVLIVFGPKRLPEMGRSLGRGMREFKDSISNVAPSEDDLEQPAVPAGEDTTRPVPATVVKATAAPAPDAVATVDEGQDGAPPQPPAGGQAAG